MTDLTSNTGIRWLHRTLDDPPKPVSDEQFAVVEREFGVKFPSDYKEVVRIYQGAMPIPNGIECDYGGSAVDYLLHFEEKPYLYSMIGAYYPIGHALPTGVIPFAKGLGDYFCFDFRDNPDSPKVVVLLHEGPGDLITLANSFTEWLGILIE